MILLEKDHVSTILSKRLKLNIFFVASIIKRLFGSQREHPHSTLKDNYHLTTITTEEVRICTYISIYLNIFHN